jgi:hypothetical protein
MFPGSPFQSFHEKPQSYEVPKITIDAYSDYSVKDVAREIAMKVFLREDPHLFHVVQFRQNIMGIIMSNVPLVGEGLSQTCYCAHIAGRRSNKSVKTVSGS